jgi:predicted AAA+ superfamily ATPase
MKDLVQKLLREGIYDKGEKHVAVTYLQQLLKNVKNQLGKKVLRQWINRTTTDTASLTPREENMLELIKRGGPTPEQFSSKN